MNENQKLSSLRGRSILQQHLETEAAFQQWFDEIPDPNFDTLGSMLSSKESSGGPTTSGIKLLRDVIGAYGSDDRCDKVFLVIKEFYPPTTFVRDLFRNTDPFSIQADVRVLKTVWKHLPPIGKAGCAWRSLDLKTNDVIARVLVSLIDISPAYPKDLLKRALRYLEEQKDQNSIEKLRQASPTIVSAIQDEFKQEAESAAKAAKEKRQDSKETSPTDPPPLPEKKTPRWKLGRR